MRKITKHIIHCSANNGGNVSLIREWHKARGWKDVGYHFIIRQDGEIEVGRTLDIIGAHCKGHNTDSIGTCLIGDLHFSQAQFTSLRRINKMLENLFPGIEVFPHNHFNKHKTCPNFDVFQEVY